jgi:hypothetical protein
MFGRSQLWNAESGNRIVPRQWKLRIPEKGAVIRILNCHWPGTILSPLPAPCSCNCPNSLKSSNITNPVLLSDHFSLHMKPIQSPDNGCSLFLWNFEISNPRCVCKLDIAGKCSQTQLYQWRCLVTIIRKTTCFGTGPSSGFRLKYLGLNTMHITRVCLHRWRDLYIITVGRQFEKLD